MIRNLQHSDKGFIDTDFSFQEILISRETKKPVITFSFFPEKKWDLKCANLAVYESLARRAIHIPSSRQSEFEGQSEIDFENKFYPKAFFEFIAPKRFPSTEYLHVMRPI